MKSNLIVAGLTGLSLLLLAAIWGSSLVFIKVGVAEVPPVTLTAVRLVLAASFLLLVMVLGVVEDAEDFADSWWMMHVLVLAVASYLILNGYGLISSGQTIGKRLLGIAVASACM